MPFILTSMGGLCSEGHEFLKMCRKRNPEKAELLMDVLVTQHSRWTARRIHRALFGQSLIDFSGDSWTGLSNQPASTSSKVSNRCKGKAHGSQTHILSNFTQQFSSKDRAEGSPDVSDDDDWSEESEINGSGTDSASECAGSCDFDSCSRKDDSACISRSRKQSSQRAFEPLSFHAASEDPAQESTENFAPLRTQATEYFVTSP